jgi:hypothetical protein
MCGKASGYRRNIEKEAQHAVVKRAESSAMKVENISLLILHVFVFKVPK